MAPGETRKRGLLVIPIIALIMLLAIVVLGGNGGAANARSPDKHKQYGHYSQAGK